MSESVVYEQQILGWNCFASLNNNIHSATDPTSVDIDYAAHMGGPKMFTERIMTTHLL